MHYNIADIENWASEYQSAPDVVALVTDMEKDRALPQPETFPVGNPSRIIAESRQIQLLNRATALGYQPPVKELVVTMAKEVVKAEFIGVAGISETATGKLIDVLPAPESASTAETEQKEAKKKKAKSRSTGDYGLEIPFN